MARLKTLKPRLQAMDTLRRPMAPSMSERRMAGRKLQERRLSIWARSPHCARCGTLTSYPNGFELDHVVPLHQGGEDSEANCQVLCGGCHARKTAEDACR
ncbi:HNH endonuclease family protein [Mizugakiibacter sediminis]|uniref:HNH endonuclease n=2 Tax=Mizugakiibacter sediminis TaxID=1475481 RepID=A0A0K8QPI6_9GAMM|nr:HNH endonuclease family protein [Mizugakiibacter sediminis]